MANKWASRTPRSSPQDALFASLSLFLSAAYEAVPKRLHGGLRYWYQGQKAFVATEKR